MFSSSFILDLIRDPGEKVVIKKSSPPCLLSFQLWVTKGQPFLLAPHCNLISWNWTWLVWDRQTDRQTTLQTSQPDMMIIWRLDSFSVDFLLQRCQFSSCEVHIVVIIWVYVARAVPVKLDFNFIPSLQWMDDQNGVRRRFTQTTPTAVVAAGAGAAAAAAAAGGVGSIVFPLGIRYHLERKVI